MAALFIGLFLIGIGFLVKAFPNLIAGYNTMSQNQKDNFDIEGLSTFMRNGFAVMGLVVIFGYYGLKWAGLNILVGYFIPVVVLAGLIFLVFRARNFDHNKDRLVKSKLVNVIRIVVLVFVAGMIGYGFVPTKYEISNNWVKFSGMYGTKINIAEIKAVALVNKMPSVKERTNGFNLGPVKKGFFSIEDQGKCRLLLHSSQGPFLKISTHNQGTVFVNFQKQEKTALVYLAIKTLKEK